MLPDHPSSSSDRASVPTGPFVPVNSPDTAVGDSESDKVLNGPQESASSGGAESVPAGQFGRYRIDGEIARGGMGAILRGRDVGLGRDIALKVLLESHRDKPEFCQRFVEEAQIAGQLQHPGVTPVYDLGQFPDHRPYFTMKLVKGLTLAKKLGDRGDPSQERAHFLKVFEQVCQTLAYAHSKRVIHRDLKPSNVMVGAFGEVQVMDWGLAKVLPEERRPAENPTAMVASLIRTARTEGAEGSGSSETESGTVLGTPAYMAPEQALGQIESIDERSDVFGLGAILCEVLTGKPPYVDMDRDAVLRKAVRADLTDAFGRLEGCGADAELVSLAKRCLSAEPETRPANAGALAEAMTRYLEGVQGKLREAELARVEAQARAGEETKRRVLADELAAAERKRRRVTLALAGVTLAAVLSAGGVYGWVQHQRGERRATQARKIDEALQRAAVHRGRASADDVAEWLAARSEAMQAAALLDEGDADPALRTRVTEVVTEVEEGLAGAERRSREAATLRSLVERLEAIRGEYAERRDAVKADRDLAQAFRDFGLDMDRAERSEIAARLADRPATPEIAAALDVWSTIRRVDLKVADEEDWRRLVDAARAADPDPWRNELRGAFGRPLADAVGTLRERAEDTEALRKQPAASLTLLALLLDRAGEKDRAVEVLRGAWQRFPGDYWVTFDLGHSSWTSGNGPSDTGNYGRPEEAVQFLTAALAARPGSVRTRNFLGNALSDLKQYVEAAEQYRLAIGINPKDPWLHHNFGNTLFELGQNDEAASEFREALDKDPKFSSALAGLAAALWAQGKIDEAEKLCREALAIDKKTGRAHTIQGNVLYDRGRFEDAAAEYRLAIDINPKDAGSQHNLGNALSELGQYENAAKAFRAALDINPKYPSALAGLAAALWMQGKLDEAEKLCRQALAIDKKMGKAHIILGNLLFDRDRFEDAAAEYRLAIDINPKDPWPHNNLGNTLRRLEKLEEATIEYRRALAINPNLWDIGEALVSTEKMILVQEKFPAFLKGEFKPRNGDELHGLQGMCALKHLPLTACRMFADAFAADPKMADDLKMGHRYDAACDAALAAAGRGADCDKLDDKEKARLRSQALTWLQADLALHQKRLERGDPAARAEAQQKLQSWLRDTDFNSVRGPEALARLSADERTAWAKLWTDVESLRKKAAGLPM
jgi:serine/threonine-protein kinase